MAQTRDTLVASPLAWGAPRRLGFALAAVVLLWLSVGWALEWW